MDRGRSVERLRRKLAQLFFMNVAAGRFAPSPTGELHLGNLRTALVAWLSARASGLRFVLRSEDLDQVTSSRKYEAGHIANLSSLGIDWDGEIVRQSERFALYDAAIGDLTEQGRTYECWCSRREIHQASSAPNGTLAPDAAYPGTCRDLSADSRRQRRALASRAPAIRLRADGESIAIVDRLRGEVRGLVDDVVLRRNDGVPAYNLAVVVDDAQQGITEVVRGDDLLGSTPRQVLLQRLLGLPTPDYVHVPLVLGPDRVRLAKRHGAVTLGELSTRGIAADQVLSLLAASLGLAAPGEVVTASVLVARFDPGLISREPWILPADLQRSSP